MEVSDTYTCVLSECMQFKTSTMVDIKVAPSDVPNSRLSRGGSAARRGMIVVGILVHEYEIFHRKVHVHGPQFLREFIV